MQVAQALQEGRTVEPEFYQCVTIFFSDIVGFTAISGILQPHEVGLSLEPADEVPIIAHMSAIFRCPPEKGLVGPCTQVCIADVPAPARRELAWHSCRWAASAMSQQGSCYHVHPGLH